MYEVRVFVTDSEDRLRLGMPVSVIVDQVEIQHEGLGAVSDENRTAAGQGLKVGYEQFCDLPR